MKTKRMRLKSKTVCKLHRLAKELEALNGVQVEWQTWIADGRRVFSFEIQARDRDKQWQLITTGYAYNLRDALRNFYKDMGDILYVRDRAKEERRWKSFVIATKPARFTAKALRDWGHGIHGKQVVLSA